MLNPEHISQLGQQILGLLPNEARQGQADLEKNLKALLQSQLDKLNLISRDEFDAQKAVLLKTRQRLEQLEAQVKQLEQNN